MTVEVETLPTGEGITLTVRDAVGRILHTTTIVGHVYMDLVTLTSLDDTLDVEILD